MIFLLCTDFSLQEWVSKVSEDSQRRKSEVNNTTNNERISTTRNLPFPPLLAHHILLCQVSGNSLATQSKPA